MTKNRPTHEQHTRGGTIFATLAAAYVMAMLVFNPSGVEEITYTQKVYFGSLVLALYFSKLAYHAKQARFSQWLVNSLAAISYFAIFVMAYPYIKAGMHYYLGL